MISQVSRFRRLVMRAVAQKRQPMAQPTWDDRQTLTAPGLWSGMITVSTARPSCGPEPELAEAVAGGDHRGFELEPGEQPDRLVQPSRNLVLSSPDRRVVLAPDEDRREQPADGLRRDAQGRGLAA